MAQDKTLPEASHPEHERFMVYGRTEILVLLRRLTERRAAATAYFARTAGSAVVELLAVDADSDLLVLDGPSDPHAYRAILAAEGLLFVAFIDQVKLQFRARKAEATDFDGSPALAVRVPTELLRLQRRDYYRVRTPEVDSAMCTVPYVGDRPGAAHSMFFAKLKVFDISLSGMSLVVRQERQMPPLGQRLDFCTLELPQIGRLDLSLHVRRVSPLPRQAPARLVGCRFIGVPETGRQMIQRYINWLGSGQLRKKAGMG